MNGCVCGEGATCDLCREVPLAVLQDRILLALIPHAGHDGIPGSPDDSCLRCNAEWAMFTPDELRYICNAVEQFDAEYGPAPESLLRKLNIDRWL